MSLLPRMATEFEGMTIDRPARPLPWRFSLAALLKGVSLVCLVLAIGVGWVLPAVRWRTDLIRVQNAGAQVYCKPARSIPWDWLRRTGLAEQVLFPDAKSLKRLATNEALRDTAKLPGVLYLRANGPQVDDSGVSALAPLKQLRFLDLSETQLTNAGLVEIARLAELRMLDLRFTQVTDAGLKSLSRLEQLNYLALRGTTVGDAGLDVLAGMKSLNEIDLRDTQVTPAGLQRFATARPEISVLLTETPTWGEP